MNKKVILGGLLGIFMVIFILSLIFTPPVQFNYLVGTIDYSTLLFIVVLLLLINFIPSFDEKRESKIYLDTHGNLDIETPREYKPIKVTPVSKILGRANIYGQKNLDYFAYNEGKIHIRNSKGDEVFGPLKDLEYTYKMDKNKGTGEWYIYQFKIKDKDGDTVQFNRHDTLFNDEEYADIEMLLSFSGTVNESKISKLTRKLDSVLSVVQELDFSNISSSAIELAETTVTEKITNKAGWIAKKRIYDKLTDKKKSLFQRIKQYFWWFLLGLALICIVWYNIALWSEASHYNMEYDSTEYNEYNSDLNEETQKVIVDLNGNIIGDYVGETSTDYIGFAQDEFKVSKANHIVVELSNQNGEGVVFCKEPGDIVKVYAYPSLNAPVIGNMIYEEGYLPDTYECIGKELNWYKIRFNHKTGYVIDDSVEWAAEDYF